MFYNIYVLNLFNTFAHYAMSLLKVNVSYIAKPCHYAVFTCHAVMPCHYVMIMSHVIVLRLYVMPLSHLKLDHYKI